MNYNKKLKLIKVSLPLVKSSGNKKIVPMSIKQTLYLVEQLKKYAEVSNYLNNISPSDNYLYHYRKMQNEIAEDNCRYWIDVLLFHLYTNKILVYDNSNLVLYNKLETMVFLVPTFRENTTEGSNEP